MRTTLFLLVAVFSSSVLPANAATLLELHLALGSPAPRVARHTDSACAGVRVMRFANYAAQAVDALVVSNAVAHGSQASTIFGSPRNATSYVAFFAAEDLIAELFTRRVPCKTKAIVQSLLGGSALESAAHTEFPQ